ncbi:MAG: 2-polyprenyl-3-methyl-6-methoxy-1,4-benzoquinone monooxygenase [Pseudomonadales bacterium]|nr:2-polyprenyl-3-methyl-6-methoxy-1,4-benzoquinone monooxygenase [Pseudomonadales bacterium]
MSFVDDLIRGVDGALRTLTGAVAAERPNPGLDVRDGSLSEEEERHAAGLMRVNHAGEICAQALYEGQALTARDSHTREALLAAAREETDHLAWCEERLEELGSRPSVLNPLFYAASYALGAATGLMGDRVSLGFVEATEDQVCRHLESHLESLPSQDERSRRIIEQMHSDEARHGAAALAAGGVEFPRPVKDAMSLASRVMTRTTYEI